ncbi:MAG TPA: hypothetical protein VHX36_13665 [Candidatus Acidoferrales bacterium]|jgi:hypothetical protein|nr:hypothetical protein [Candidatus Acidoferrales bacterium]
MLLRSIAAPLACALYLAALASAPSASAQDQSAAQRAAAEAADLRFSGEALPGKAFVRDIGHGLVFGLAPLAGTGGDGWVIDIVPKAQSTDDPAEFSEIVTPPYHFYNDRYLAAAYGYSAKEAVQMTTRKFNFVLSVSDEQKANDVVNAALYPVTTSDEEKDRIARESASVQLGRGELHITHSHVTLGKGDTPDSIDVLKFDVAIYFSPGLTLAQVLAPKPTRSHR